MLDAILMPDWEYRYFSFNNFWDTNESMASMRDGEGNGYFIVFGENGVVGKGFQKENSLDFEERKRLLKHVPKVFNSFINEPAFMVDSLTYIFWRKTDELVYSSGVGFAV